MLIYTDNFFLRERMLDAHTSPLDENSEKVMSVSCRLINTKPAAYRLIAPRCSTYMPTVAGLGESLSHTIVTPPTDNVHPT